MSRVVASSQLVSNQMRALRTRDTTPELALRRVLHRRGLRFRVQYRLPQLQRRTIDIAFPRQRVAVFVNGCFWHGCQHHRGIPKHNREWWSEKIDGNIARDQDTDQRLAALGWMSIGIWEHDETEESANIVEMAACARRPIK